MHTCVCGWCRSEVLTEKRIKASLRNLLVQHHHPTAATVTLYVMQIIWHFIDIFGTYLGIKIMSVRMYLLVSVTVALKTATANQIQFCKLLNHNHN